MKNVLITGVAGFVGAHLARYLLREGYNVVGVFRDYVPMDYFRFVAGEGATLVRCDVTCPRSLIRVMSDYDIDTVFHLAAQAIVRRALKDPVGTFDTNVVGTVSVLEAARAVGVEYVLVASTDKVYGNRENARETDPLSPVDIYGASKAAADLAAQAFARVYSKPRVCVTRACNIYGFDLNPRIVPNTVLSCLRGDRPAIYRGVAGRREYMFVHDAVAAYALLAKRREEGIYNVGTGEVRSQEEVVREVCKHFGVEPRYVEPPPHVSKEVESQSVDSSKIRGLGWRPRYSFEEGIARTVEAFRRWWRSRGPAKG